MVVDVAPALSIATHPDGTARVQGHRVSRTLLLGHVRPALPHEPLAFVIQRHLGRRWHTVAGNQFTMQGGTVPVFFYTNRPGLLRVRTMYSGDPNYAHTKSAWKKFRVRPF